MLKRRSMPHTAAVRRYGLYIFDLDGTLYRGNQALPGAVDAVKVLKGAGAQIRYLTNNSSLTRGAYLTKLSGMGFPAVLDEIYSSAIGGASYCMEIGLKNLFVVGEPGLVLTMRSNGLNVLNAPADGVVQSIADGLADAVVAGIHKSFNYAVMNAAMQHVLRGARLIATNTDATYPMEEGQFIPGAGAIVSSLETCTGQEAYVVGKPNPFLIELVIKDSGVKPQDTLVVGDRYETDIESGIRAGVDTHLVLTGVTGVAPPGQSFSSDLRGLIKT